MPDDAAYPRRTLDAFDDVLARSTVAVLAVVLGFVALVYLPTLSFELIYDDGWTLIGNGFLRHPEDLPLLLTPQAHAQAVPDAFRPVAVVFDVATYQWVGLRPWAHHAISVALHLAACAALAAWLGNLGASPRLRLTAVALFGLLGLHAEAVSVVSFREDLLAAALGLTALTLAQRASRSTPTIALAATLSAGVLLALACGAKASAAALPGLWILGQILRPFRASAPAPKPLRTIAIAAVLVAGVAAAIALRVHTVGGLSPYGADNPAVYATRVGRSAVLAASTQIHLLYAWQMLVPTGLGPEHVDYGAAWTDPATLLALGALGLGLGFALASWRTRPVLAFAVLGTAGLMLPTSNLFDMPNMRADRLVYLAAAPACVGLAALAWWVGRRWSERRGLPALAFVPVATLLVVQGAAARAASAVYRSDTRLWEIALRQAPDSARAHAIVSEQLLHRFVETGSTDDGVLARAKAHCDIARVRDPLDPLSWLCHGRLAMQAKRWDVAHRDLSRALALSRQRQDAIAAGIAELTLARTDLPFEIRSRQALAQIEEITASAPYSAAAALAAGQLHHQLGQAQLAQNAYARASSLRPERWDLVARRVELELDLGHPSAARTVLAAVDARTTTADPVLQSMLIRRLALAQRWWPND